MQENKYIFKTNKAPLLATALGLISFFLCSYNATTAQLVPLSESQQPKARTLVELARRVPYWKGKTSLTYGTNIFCVNLEATFNADGVSGLCTLKFDAETSSIHYPGMLRPFSDGMVIAENVPFHIRYENNAAETNFEEVYFDLWTTEQDLWVCCGRTIDLKKKLSGLVGASAEKFFWLGPMFTGLKEERKILKELEREQQPIRLQPQVLFY